MIGSLSVYTESFRQNGPVNIGSFAMHAVEDMVRSTAVQAFVSLYDVAISLAVLCKLCSTIICMSFALLLQAQQSRILHCTGQPVSRHYAG